MVTDKKKFLYLVIMSFYRRIKQLLKKCFRLSFSLRKIPSTTFQNLDFIHFITAFSVSARFQGIYQLFIFPPADIGVVEVSWLGMMKLMKKIVHPGM